MISAAFQMLWRLCIRSPVPTRLIRTYVTDAADACGMCPGGADRPDANQGMTWRMRLRTCGAYTVSSLDGTGTRPSLLTCGGSPSVGYMTGMDSSLHGRALRATFTTKYSVRRDSQPKTMPGIRNGTKTKAESWPRPAESGNCGVGVYDRIDVDN